MIWTIIHTLFLLKPCGSKIAGIYLVNNNSNLKILKSNHHPHNPEYKLMLDYVYERNDMTHVNSIEQDIYIR